MIWQTISKTKPSNPELTNQKSANSANLSQSSTGSNHQIDCRYNCRASFDKEIGKGVDFTPENRRPSSIIIARLLGLAVLLLEEIGQENGGAGELPHVGNVVVLSHVYPAGDPGQERDAALQYAHAIRGRVLGFPRWSDPSREGSSYTGIVLRTQLAPEDQQWRIFVWGFMSQFWFSTSIFVHDKKKEAFYLLFESNYWHFLNFS